MQRVLWQLWLALEADTWVGARGCSAGRLADQLRCVLVAKCGAQPFLELGPDSSWKGYAVQ